jgi:cytochrome b561
VTPTLDHQPAYTAVARTFHWLTAALVLTMVPLGVVIANEAGGAWQDGLYNLHKSLGVVVLVLVVLRLLYRLTHRPAPLPSDVPALQQFAASAVHWALYVLLIVQPLLGYIGTISFPAPVPVFGLFDMPMIVPADRALSNRLLGLHGTVGLLIGVLALMHIGAALYHHFVRRDRVLMRMLTG